jgi:cytochrome oxidase Cu insertion factor (SCO1/SenC/PrrC family)
MARDRSRVLLAVSVAAVAAAGVFAGVAVHVAHDRQADAPRTSGLPASVSTAAADLMELSPVPHVVAPPFRFVDQRGRTVTLASLRGKVVILEFMDPHCTDLCPIVSQEFVDANRDLGAARRDVVFAAINVNPFVRSVAAAATYSRAHGLDAIPSWHFLTGSLAALHAAWRGYGVEVEAPSPTADVIHSSYVYFLDPSGTERYLGSPTEDHTRSGAAYLPGGQLAAWGRGIAAVARSLGA